MPEQGRMASRDLSPSASGVRDGGLIGRLIRWAERTPAQEVVSFDGKHGFWRYAPFWPDEFHDERDGGKVWSRPPWWRPFNILLHCWDPEPGYEEEMHDHPRWSVTICLRGKVIERTPWGERTLTPGSVVVRSRKAIHGLGVPEGYSGKSWTMFIVGRRNYRQNTYSVVAR